MFNIDKIFIINLKHEINKRKKMENLIPILENISSNIEFVEAVNGNAIEIDTEYSSSKGSYGCCLSHLACIKDAVCKKYENILIFEDDIILRKDFVDIWKTLECPSTNWDLLYLGGTQLDWNGIFKNGTTPFENGTTPFENGTTPFENGTTPNLTWYKAKNTLGGFAYIVNKSIFQLIIDTFSIFKKPIDEIYMKIQDEINAFVYYPNLVIAFLDESTTRENNTWSLDTYSAKLGWKLDDYDLTMYKARNIRATNRLLMHRKMYSKYLKYKSIPKQLHNPQI